MLSELEKWIRELRKGSTKLAMLSLLEKQDMYGYELTREHNKRTEGVVILQECNAYLALHALESNGLIQSYWKDAGPGMPPRKYYRITPQGKTFLEDMKDEWEKHSEAMRRIWGK